MHHLEECVSRSPLISSRYPFVGIFTRTLGKAHARSLTPVSVSTRGEGSLNRRLCQSYSAQIREHKDRPRIRYWFPNVCPHSSACVTREKASKCASLPGTFFDLIRAITRAYTGFARGRHARDAIKSRRKYQPEVSSAFRAPKRIKRELSSANAMPRFLVRCAKHTRHLCRNDARERSRA